MGQYAFTTLLRGPWRKVGLAVAILLFVDLLWIFVRFPLQAQGHIFSETNLPPVNAPVLILGAGVLPGKEPTQVLQGRLETALGLFRAKKVRWFLVSGDNRTMQYNEPQAMRKWLLKHEVPPILVVSDYAGRRTYDSLKRAKIVFGLQRLVIVTSDFHLVRALYLAQSLGIEAWGVPSSTEEISWSKRIGFWKREYVARHLAIWDTWLPPDTLLGPREPTPDDLFANPAPEMTQ